MKAFVHIRRRYDPVSGWTTTVRLTNAGRRLRTWLDWTIACIFATLLLLAQFIYAG